MRVVTAIGYGEPSVLRVEDHPFPEPGSGEVVVEVKAAGINLMDSNMRRGLIPSDESRLRFGVEGAGVVLAVGEGSRAAVGDRVVWERALGSYAEAVAVPDSYLVSIPAGVSFEAAAGGLMQGLTAQHLCYDAVPVPKGAVVLVHSAASGVGRMLTQLVTHQGGRVIATVSRAHKAESAFAAGAWQVIVRDEVSDIAAAVRDSNDGRRANIVFDGAGKTLFDASMASLGFGGIFVHYGRAGGEIPPISLWDQPDGVHLVRVRGNAGHESLDRWRERATQVVQWISEGTLEVLIDRTYPLEDAASAHADLESQNTVGKLLLVP